jgi:hypothetical protein
MEAALEKAEAEAAAAAAAAAAALAEEESTLGLVLEESLDLTTTASAWLREESEHLAEELQRLSAQAEAEAATAQQQQALAAMAAEHIRRLRARLSAREKHAAAVRVTLEAGHIVTPKELQQVLTTMERKLDAEEAIVLEHEARFRLTSQIKSMV